ncbi:EVE domain-containing protein [Actinoplanes subtropicus]|uniref:EVE domain-containing protein n=1 Tax=Actinoplanes subtropicus TaxID=543632 RepID=UPI0009FC1569|nr:EVE domain-containing protein [Actinoplanes subtropicus]
MRAWLGVVCRDHVLRGARLGIAQIGHGKRDGLARLAAGDWLVYYSPRTSLRDGAPLQAFTALGRIADDEIWQAHEGDFHPWRRRADYLPGAVETPIKSLRLDLTDRAGWGATLRRGLVRLTDDDFARIHAAMRAPGVAAGAAPGVAAGAPPEVAPGESGPAAWAQPVTA